MRCTSNAHNPLLIVKTVEYLENLSVQSGKQEEKKALEVSALSALCSAGQRISAPM